MVNAQFPGVSNEYVTGKYTLRGTKNDFHFQFLIQHWIFRAPSTIKDLPAFAQSVKHNANAGSMKFWSSVFLVGMETLQTNIPTQTNNQRPICQVFCYFHAGLGRIPPHDDITFMHKGNQRRVNFKQERPAKATRFKRTAPRARAV